MLIFVLVFMVLAALLALPILTYAHTVLRANSLVSAKAQRQEAVKAGLWTALADPLAVYHHCLGESTYLGVNTSIDNMATIGSWSAADGVNNVEVVTECDLRRAGGILESDDMHLGLTATVVGASIPEVLKAGEEFYFEPSSYPDYVKEDWYSAMEGGEPAPYAATMLATKQRIWAPNLPVLPGAVRSSTPFYHQYSPGCRLFFPGVYRDPVTLFPTTGPGSGGSPIRYYFLSGVYYFEDTVTVLPGVDAVVGDGSAKGCAAGDDDAVAYSGIDVGGVEDGTVTGSEVWINQPQNSPPLVDGLGATWVLGHDARVVIRNDHVSGAEVPGGSGSYQAAPVRLEFNQRYVHQDDLDRAPTFGVSIMSVNGAVDNGPADGGAGIEDVVGADGLYERLVDLDLDLPNVQVHVPASIVGGVGQPEMYKPLCGSVGAPAEPNCLPPAQVVSCPPYDRPQDLPRPSPVPCPTPAKSSDPSLRAYIPSSHTYAPRRPSPPLGVYDGDGATPDEVQATIYQAGTGQKAWVRWDAPARPGGEPIFYEVHVTRDGVDAPGCTSPALTTEIPDLAAWLAIPVDQRPGGDHECVLPITQPTGTYRFTVTATNSKGTSDPSAERMVSTQNPSVVPGAPTNVDVDAMFRVDPAIPDPAPVVGPYHEASSTAVISWDAGAVPVGAARVASYTVEAIASEPSPLPPPPDPPLAYPVLPTEPAKCSIELPQTLTQPANPDRPDETVPPAVEPTTGFHCRLEGLNPYFDYQVTVTATDVTGATSAASGPMSLTSADWDVANPTPAPPVYTLPCDATRAYAPERADDPTTPEDETITYDETNHPGCADWEAPARVTYRHEPDPIVDIILTNEYRTTTPGGQMKVAIRGYVSVPQGVFRMFDRDGIVCDPALEACNDTVSVTGGILAASFRVRSDSADPDRTIPVGLISPDEQRTFTITTATVSGTPYVASTAVVQINTNGNIGVNSWTIQSCARPSDAREGC